MARKRRPNGAGKGNQISLEFDLDDPTQARAFEIAQRLAMPHGRRKGLLIACLNAIGDMEQRLGQEVSADMIAGIFLGMGAGVQSSRPTFPLPEEENPVQIIVGSAKKADAQQQARRALSKRANLLK